MDAAPGAGARARASVRLRGIAVLMAETAVRTPAAPTSPLLPAERPAGRRQRTPRPPPHTVWEPLLSRRQQAVLHALGLSWLGTAAWFWLWWLDADHRVGLLPAAVNTAVLAFDLALLPAVGFWFLLRGRRRRGTTPPAGLRVAMVVTKAPSEPWSLVRDTLRAMLVQDYPSSYDVWLADEDPGPVARRWCEAHGVRISTRHGVAGYHQPRWPRRRRCKEGNLAFFYDHYGYDRYDIVAQLDADHVPAVDYLRHMVAPFADARVGYVAAPSICDSNAAASWAARGRLYFEAALHGATQAAGNRSGHPVCIGSHYAVRCTALEEIGGLGPELAEDFSTTLAMAAHGWRGVFAMDAEAHGEGPETLTACLTQEYQWSASITTILLKHTPRYWRSLPRGSLLRFGLTQLWYPAVGLAALVSVLLPAVAIWTATPFARVSVASFGAHVAPQLVAILVVTWWLRRCSALRPVDAKLLSWEAVLFNLVRWPWVLLGSLKAVRRVIRPADEDWIVTPKGGVEGGPLPARIILVPLALSAICAVSLLLAPDPGLASGYVLWCRVNTWVYLAVAVAILALHARELRRRAHRLALPRRWSMQGVGVLGVSTVAGLALAVQVPVLTQTTLPVALASAGVPSAADAQSRIAIGITTPALTVNTTRPWGIGDLAEINGFERTANKHADVVLWFADWQHTRLDLRQLAAIAARGSVPEITWEPWDSWKGTHVAQPGYRLRTIVAGNHDGYIRTWAQGLRRYGHGVRLRFGHEMNGDWYPWSEDANGNHRGDYVRAWRHIHDIFTQEGATNVKWVWSPVARRMDPGLYPGDAYVDAVGLSGFNGGTELRAYLGWRSFADIFGRWIERVMQLAPGKPIEISEVSTVERGGSKAAWIRDLFSAVQRWPAIDTVIWFNAAKEADWRIESSPASTRAFREAVHPAVFGHTVMPAAVADGRRGALGTVDPPGQPYDGATG
jgi:cellulose synthase (UDP-forming)